MIKIPHEALSHDALLGVIDDFIHREGTDYGHRDYSLAEKREAVLRALETGQAAITFDPATGTTTLLVDSVVDRVVGDPTSREAP